MDTPLARWDRDRHLAGRLLRGDEGAFEELLRDHAQSLYRFALARLRGDRAAAEDAVQSTLARAMEKLHTFRGEASLLTWLTTLCAREMSAERRRNERRPTVALEDEVPEIRAALEVLERGLGDPERDTLQAEVRALVIATLDRLPPRYAQALRWKYVEGLSMREIADQLGSGELAVQSVLQRARTAFREGFRSVGGAAALDNLDT